MNEFELKLKQAIEKEACRHTHSDSELEKIKSAETEPAKYKTSRIYAIAASLTFIILAAAVAGIILKGNPNPYPGQSTYSGGLYPDSSEITYSEVDISDISEISDDPEVSEISDESEISEVSEVSEVSEESETSEDIIGNTLIERHPELESLPEGAIFSYKPDFGSKQEVSYTGEQAVSAYDFLIKPQVWQYRNKNAASEVKNARAITFTVGSHTMTVYDNNFMCLDGSEWYFINDISLIDKTVTLKDNHPGLVPGGGQTFAIAAQGLGQYDNMAKLADFIWEIVAENALVYKADPVGYALIFTESDGYVRFDITGKESYTAFVYGNGIIRIDFKGKTDYYSKGTGCDLDWILTIITKIGRENFYMQIDRANYKKVIYIAGVCYEYIFSNVFEIFDYEPVAEIKEIGYSSICGLTYDLDVGDTCYSYPFASVTCYSSGGERWYPVCSDKNYVNSWDLASEAKNFYYTPAYGDSSVRINGIYYKEVIPMDLTEGEYYVTFRGIKYKCDTLLYVLIDGVYYVYPCSMQVHYTGGPDYDPVADDYIRVYKPEIITAPNVDITIDDVKYFYSTNFDGMPVFLVSKPEVKGGIHYYTLLYYNKSTQKYVVVNKDLAIPGGIASIVLSSNYTIEITDNDDKSLPVTTVWRINGSGKVTKLNTTKNGSTYAEIHPDKLDITGYIMVYYAKKGITHEIRGSAMTQIYASVIEGGRLAKADASVVIPDNIPWVTFMVRLEVDDMMYGYPIMNIIYMTVYENGYVKFHMSDLLNSNYELYYNPKGYDLEKLFNAEEYQSETYFKNIHPKIVQNAQTNKLKIIPVKVPGAMENYVKSYEGYLALVLYNTMIGDGTLVKANIDGKNLGDYYEFNCSLNNLSFNIRAYDNVLACKEENGDWQYYNWTGLAEYLTNLFLNDISLYISEENTSFEIKGVKIAYEVWYDKQNGFAISSADGSIETGHYHVFHTSDGGKTWTEIYDDLEVTGYIQCLKAVDPQTLVYADSYTNFTEFIKLWRLDAKGRAFEEIKFFFIIP